MNLSTNNIFSVGLEDQPGKVAELHFRANLVLTLSNIVRANGWSLEQAAERLRISQLEVSALLNLRDEVFSSERLLVCLGELGYLVTVSYDRDTQAIGAEADQQKLAVR